MEHDPFYQKEFEEHIACTWSLPSGNPYFLVADKTRDIDLWYGEEELSHAWSAWRACIEIREAKINDKKISLETFIENGKNCGFGLTNNQWRRLYTVLSPLTVDIVHKDWWEHAPKWATGIRFVYTNSKERPDVHKPKTQRDIFKERMPHDIVDKFSDGELETIAKWELETQKDSED